MLTNFRLHELSPNFIQSDEVDLRLRTADYATKAAEAVQAYTRWTILWRSIVLSSLDQSTVRLRQPYFHRS